jgi:O-antigen/teichoic acid export membrane protein
MTRSKIVENTVSLGASNLSSLVFTTIQLGVLSRFLGGDRFGLFVSLRGFALLIGTFALAGLPQVLIRFFPSYQRRSRRSTALLLFLASASVIAILGAVAYRGADIWSGLIPEQIRSYLLGSNSIEILVLVSVSIAAKMILYGAFSGLREMKMQLVLEFLYSISLTIFVVARREALDVAMLFRAIAILNGAVFVLGLPLLVYLLFRLIPADEEATGDQVYLPPLFPYWCGSIVLSFVALAFTDVDRFVMSIALPVSAISLFHIASRINFILKRFLGIPILAAQPEITRVYEEGRSSIIAGKIRLFIKVTLVSSLFLIGLFSVIGRDVIHLLSGEEFLAAYPLMLLLLPTIPIAAVSAPLLATMRSLHYMRWAIACDLIWMAVYFGLFFLIVRIIGTASMAVAQSFAALAQMVLAVRWAKREGFFGGIGDRLGRVVIALLVLVPVGAALTVLGGLYASVAVLVLSPFIGRLVISKLEVFESGEIDEILEMIPFASGRRLIGWILQTGV